MKTTVRILLCALLLTFTPTVFAQDDPTVVAPTIYKKIFENDQVRVLEINFKPGEKIASHSHPAHVAYIVNGGKIQITDSTGKPMESEAKPGDVLWFDPVTHSAVNTGKTDMKIVVVELKKK
jgi:beta-alanine degradation protein BauB